MWLISRNKLSFLNSASQTKSFWYSINSANETWQSTVGLEIHAQLNTNSKLFSGAENTFGGLVNNCVSLFDAAIPGTLPVLNRECVKLALKTALALSCQINEFSSFDRKHYFYADLPAGYQITQQRAPLASGGVLNFQVYTPGIHKKPYKKSSKLKQIQLEQDSGKSLHDTESKRSLVDLNRAGCPLIELVFEPDLQDGEEAAALVKEVMLIVQRLGVCSGHMEEGALRVDANVSIRRPGEPLGTRTEIKNIGSVRGVAGAVKHEIERQSCVLAAKGKILNETRAWDAVRKLTVPMRDKEMVQDYRYMPEPNLPLLKVNINSKEESQDILSVPLLRDQIPELPEQCRQRLVEQFNLRPEIAIQLVNEPILLKYFEGLTRQDDKNAVKIANILINDLMTVFNKINIDSEDCPLSVAQIKEILDMYFSKQISLEICRNIMSELIISPCKSPSQVVQENSWLLVTDESVITEMCSRIINDNPKLVLQYKAGKEKMLKALLGMLAKSAGNKIDMSIASRKLEELLKK